MIVQLNFGVGVDRHGHAIPGEIRERALKAIAEYASKTFGGCNLVNALGYWYDGDKLVVEPSVTLTTYTTEQLTQTHYKLKWFCSFIKEQLSQSAVCVNICESDFVCG